MKLYHMKNRDPLSVAAKENTFLKGKKEEYLTNFKTSCFKLQSRKKTWLISGFMFPAYFFDSRIRLLAL